jgi:hypothetical protein
MSKQSEIVDQKWREKIRSDPVLAFKVLRVVWERQSEFEKFAHVYDKRDSGKSRGFSPGDTRPANELYERWKDVEFRWTDLKGLDVVRCQRMMQKYHRQYRDEMEALRARDLEASRRAVGKALDSKRARERQRSVEKYGEDAVTD